MEETNESDQKMDQSPDSDPPPVLEQMNVSTSEEMAANDPAEIQEGAVDDLEECEPPIMDSIHASPAPDTGIEIDDKTDIEDKTAEKTEAEQITIAVPIENLSDNSNKDTVVVEDVSDGGEKKNESCEVEMDVSTVASASPRASSETPDNTLASEIKEPDTAPGDTNSEPPVKQEQVVNTLPETQSYQAAFEQHVLGSINSTTADDTSDILADQSSQMTAMNTLASVALSERSLEEVVQPVISGNSPDIGQSVTSGVVTLLTTTMQLSSEAPVVISTCSPVLRNVAAVAPVNVVSPVTSQQQPILSTHIQKMSQQTRMIQPSSEMNNSATQQLQNLALQQIQQGCPSQIKQHPLPLLQIQSFQDRLPTLKPPGSAPVAIVTAQSGVPTMVTGLVRPQLVGRQPRPPTTVMANILPKPVCFQPSATAGSPVQFVTSNGQPLPPGIVAGPITNPQVISQLQALAMQQNLPTHGAFVASPTQLSSSTGQPIFVRTSPAVPSKQTADLVNATSSTATVTSASPVINQVFSCNTPTTTPAQQMTAILPGNIQTTLSSMPSTNMIPTNSQGQMIAMNSQGVGVAINPFIVRRPTRGRPRKFPRPNMGNRLPAPIKPKVSTVKASEVRGRGTRRVGRPRGSTAARRLEQIGRGVPVKMVKTAYIVKFPTKQQPIKPKPPVLPVLGVVTATNTEVNANPVSISPFTEPRLGVQMDTSSPHLPIRQKAIVRPHIMNHMIEGLLIQECVEPFPVQRSSLLTDLNPPNKQARSDKLDGQPMKKQKAPPVEPQTYLKCEFCGKVDKACRFRRSKRFCSLACSKRYNVGCSKRLGLFRPPNRPAGTSMPDRPTCKHKKGFLVKKEWRRGHLPFSATGPTVNETIVDPPNPEDNKIIHEQICEEQAIIGDQTGSSEHTSSESISSQDENVADNGHPVLSHNREMPGEIHRQPMMGLADHEEIEETESSNTSNVESNVEDIRFQSHPATWTVKDVYDFIKSLSGCESYANEFRSQEIDGQALLLLKEDHLMSAMNMKLGPALKVCAKINSLKGEHH